MVWKSGYFPVPRNRREAERAVRDGQRLDFGRGVGVDEGCSHK